ncbi:MAG: hypothetical protein EBS01_10655, partial [Verrucomicrobia bacterium]|nr:hypothetical protein [Verrucomicrobiota bacterium]
LLLRGDNLGSGSVASSGSAVVTLASLPVPAAQGGGSNGTTIMSVRPDIIADASSTGLGTGFVTRDTTLGVLRPLNPVTELLLSTGSLTNATTTQNVGLSSLQTLTASSALNTLTLLSGGSLGTAAGTPDTTKLTLTAGGILSLSGVSSLNVPILTAAGTLDIITVGSSTLNLTGAIISTGGFVKAGDGRLVLNSPQYYTGGIGTVINGGTLQLNGGANTLLVVPTATTPTVLDLYVNNYGTLNLNGNNQAVGQLISSNQLPGLGGNVFSTSSATLTLSSTSSNTFAGGIFGAISLTKQGAGTETFTGINTYTGLTTVAGGVLVLKDGGLLANTGGIITRQGATLILDNSGLVPLTAPIGSGSVTLAGGTLQLKAPQGNASATVGALVVGAGASTINQTLFNSSATGSGSSLLTLASLTQQPGSYGVLNFTSVGGLVGFPVTGIMGQIVSNSGNNVQYLINSTPTMTNGILGGWAVVNGSDWAAYRSTLDPISGALGVGTLGMSLYGSTPFGTYSSGLLSSVASTMTSGTVNAAYTGNWDYINSVQVNSLRLPVSSGGGFWPIVLQGGDKLLNVVSGGVLTAQGTGSTSGITFYGGQVTAGSQSGGMLYMNNFGLVAQVAYSSITDNPFASVGLVKAGTAALTLNTVPAFGNYSTTTNSRIATFPANSMSPATPGLVPGMTLALATVGGIAAGQYVTSVLGSGTQFMVSGTVSAGSSNSTNAPGLFLYPSAQVLPNVVFSSGASTITVPQGTYILPGGTVTYVSGSDAMTLTGGSIASIGTYNVTYTGTFSLTPGMYVSGTGLPTGGTLITAVNGNTLTLAGQTTGTTTGAGTSFLANAVTYSIGTVAAVSGTSLTLTSPLISSGTGALLFS